MLFPLVTIYPTYGSIVDMFHVVVVVDQNTHSSADMGLTCMVNLVP